MRALLMLCACLMASPAIGDGEHSHAIPGELVIESDLVDRIYQKSLETHQISDHRLSFSVGGGQTQWQKLTLKNSYFRFPYEKVHNPMPFITLGLQWRDAWFAQLTAATYQGVFSVENPNGQRFQDTVDTEFWATRVGYSQELGRFWGGIYQAHLGLGAYAIGQSGHLDGLTEIFFVPMALWGLGVHLFAPDSMAKGEWQGVTLQASGMTGLSERYELRGVQWIANFFWAL